MKTLVQYLADYLDQEVVMSRPNNGKMQALNAYEIYEIVRWGIDDYQSTENCTIGICGGACPECKIPLERDIAMLYNGEDEIEVCKYECPECGYIVYG